MIVKAVLFDLDGTLVDSNDYHLEAWERAFQQCGFDLDRKAIHDQIGKGSDNFVPALVPDADAATQDELRRIHSEIFQGEFLPRVRPFPGARDLLVRTREAGKRVVLASSAAEKELEHYLDLLGARDIVEASTSAADVEHTKPEPDIFAAALTKIAPLAAENALVVGDTPWDIQAGARCGIRTIALLSGKFDPEWLRKTGAIALYDDAAALLAGFETSPLAE